MFTYRCLAVALIVLTLCPPPRPASACCPAPPSGQPVVNADQTVVIVWDAANKTQHFIRRASFKSEADDFGFLVPTPTQPELSESGDGVFPVLASITAPRVTTVARPTSGGGCGCSKYDTGAAAPKAAAVKVLDDKVVAGFRAVVLETRSSEDLVEWLKTNGYAFSPEIQAWAKPYVEQGWKITALKVAKANPADAATAPATATAPGKDVSAAALRLSFKTDRPLFPYREPDPKTSAQKLGATSRLLRIYFIAEARYQGELTATDRWTGNPAWAGKLSPADRKRALDLLQLPETAAPAECWLTEFEDNWPYRAAPADVYFARAADQSTLERRPIIQYAAVAPVNLVEAVPYAVVIAMVGAAPFLRRLVGRRSGSD